MRSETTKVTGRAGSGWWPTLSRTMAALLGGYGFVWGATTLGTALGMQLGMPYGEAQMLLYLLAFLLFTAVFCWAFYIHSLWRVWLTLVGGGLVMTGLGWLLAGQ